MSSFFSREQIRPGQQNRDVDVEKGINGETEFVSDKAILENAKENEDHGQTLEVISETEM